MRLFIAEKPSVARAIAQTLGATGKGDGYIQCGADVIITWCFGHMLEQVGPDAYTPDSVPVGKSGNKIWRTDELPIIPQQWILRPKDEAKKQLSIIGKLIKQASEIVNAGDPDREGQLLIDEVIEHFKCTKPVLRYWASAQDATSVKRALSDLKDNNDYKGWSHAALGRARADWLIGMNLSRAFTLSAARGGQRALLTVGRVQTPTLAIVVSRDREIESFKATPFHTIKASIRHPGGSFTATWKAGDNQPGLDAEGRLIDTRIADAIVAATTGQAGRITACRTEPKKQGQPRSYSLADITLAASNKWGYSAQQVLETCQSLYEKKLTSYARTDCAYLPESQHADAQGILASLKANNPALGDLANKADPGIKSATWNDSKITAHHGIIPTAHRADLGALAEPERNIYDLVINAYIAQFYPAYEYMSTTATAQVAGHAFTAIGRVVTQNGWKDVISGSEDRDDGEGAQALPAMAAGDQISCIDASRTDAKTKPPARFNEGTLIKAMENVHAFVADPAHRKMLREGDAIGTSATRASIISELKRRGFIEPKGKQVISTPLGRSMIDALPAAVKAPGLTALFERVLKQVQDGKTTLADFVSAQETFVRQEVAAAGNGDIKIEGVVQNANKAAASAKKRSTAPARAPAKAR